MHKQKLGKTFYLTLISLCVFTMAGCRKPAIEDVQYGMFFPSNFQVEYEVKGGYTDYGIYIRKDNQIYVKHERSSGGLAEFFGFEENNVGFNDGQGDIQDYITFRLFGTEWIRAVNWNDNINYYSLMGSGSWSPYQSGTVRGPFYYMGMGVNMLNNELSNYTMQAEESISIPGGVFACLVYTRQETYTTATGPKVATTKYWIEKTTLICFKKAATYDAADDINADSAVEYKITKFFAGPTITFPVGVPLTSD